MRKIERARKLNSTTENSIKHKISILKMIDQRSIQLFNSIAHANAIFGLVFKIHVSFAIKIIIPNYGFQNVEINKLRICLLEFFF